MKKKIFVLLGLGFLVFLVSVSALAQSDDSKTQLYVVWDDIVHPSKFLDYEAAYKEWAAFAGKYDFPYPTTTYRTENFHYYTLMPITKMGDLDEIEKFWAELGKKIGKELDEEYAKLSDLFAGTYESGTFGVIALRMDLSYKPENPRVASQDMNYFQWNFYFIKTGKEKEAEALAKEWQELFKKNGIEDGFNVFQSIMWSDMPGMLSVSGSGSKTDLVNQNAENYAKMGAAYDLLFKKTMDLCRSFDVKKGTILRECSYTIKK